MGFRWQRFALKRGPKLKEKRLGLVCHVGLPKTGSTFLQNACARNGELLARNGVVYPNLLSKHTDHITLFFIASKIIHPFAREYGLQNDRDVAELRKILSNTLIEQINQAPPGITTMFMSSENLSGSLRRPGIAALADFLNDHFIAPKILFYVRRQDDALLSMYAEYMKRGFSHDSFEAFIDKQLGEDPQLFFLAFKQVFADWIEIFGVENVSVRIFDTARFADGDIFSDCLTEISGNKTPDLDGFEVPKQSNPSLSAPALEFLHRINSALPYAVNEVPNPARARLLSRIVTLPNQPRPQMSTQMSDRIMDHFANDNNWLHQTFFPDEPGGLFPQTGTKNTAGNLGQLSIEEFGRFSDLVFR